jgi:hypothetical protein
VAHNTENASNMTDDIARNSLNRQFSGLDPRMSTTGRPNSEALHV